MKTATALLIHTLASFLIPSFLFAIPPVELYDEGSSQGRPVFELDCVGTNISCARSGIRGTITIGSDAHGDGANCSAGSYPLGVDASGVAQSCTDASTEIDSIVATHAADTDAHQDEVTLGGTGTYISIAGQVITVDPITESDIPDLTHTTDTNTNANTQCSGTTTYYDGEGNCDDISSVYEPAGITESDISDLSHTTDTNANTICTGTGNYLDGEGNCDALVTNATHTGDVTGDTALTIGADKVLESHLKAVDTAVDEECLTYESTTGDFEWQTCGGAGHGDGANCSANEFPLGVDANGAVQSCTVLEEAIITDLDHTATDITFDIIQYTDIFQNNTLAGNLSLAVDECFFTATTSGGGFICEGSTADTSEQHYLFPDVNGADTTNYIPVHGAQITNMAGNGISVSAGALVADLGTTIVTDDITDNEILEADLKIVDSPTDEECLTYEATGGDFEWQACDSPELEKRSFGTTIDGGGSAITVGQKGYIVVPYACTISEATVLLDQSGSIVIDVWKDTYANYPPVDADSITASAPPTVTTATKSQDSTLTGWTTSVSAGDIIGFNVDSITTATRATLSIQCDV